MTSLFGMYGHLIDNSDTSWLIYADMMDENDVPGGDELREMIRNPPSDNWEYQWRFGGGVGFGGVGFGGVGGVGGGVGGSGGGVGGGVGGVGGGVGGGGVGSGGSGGGGVGGSGGGSGGVGGVGVGVGGDVTPTPEA
jgi:hypothetical protein